MTNVVRMPETAKIETWADLKQRYVDEREAAIMDLADAGHTVTEAAAKLGIDHRTMLGFIGLHNVCVKFARKKHCSQAWSELVEERREMSKRGITVMEAAAEIGITTHTLRLYSEKHNIKWKSQGHWPRATA